MHLEIMGIVINFFLYACALFDSSVYIYIVDGELDITTMNPTLLSQIQDNQQLGK